MAHLRLSLFRAAVAGSGLAAVAAGLAVVAALRGRPPALSLGEGVVLAAWGAATTLLYEAGYVALTRRGPARLHIAGATAGAIAGLASVPFYAARPRRPGEMSTFGLALLVAVVGGWLGAAVAARRTAGRGAGVG